MVPYEAFGHVDTTHCNLSKIGSKNNVLCFCEPWNCILKAYVSNWNGKALKIENLEIVMDMDKLYFRSTRKFREMLRKWKFPIFQIYGFSNSNSNSLLIKQLLAYINEQIMSQNKQFIVYNNCCIHQPWPCNISFLIVKLVFRNIHIFFADKISSGFSISRIEILLDYFWNMLLYFSLVSRYTGQYRIKCSSSSISVWQEKQNRWSLCIGGLWYLPVSIAKLWELILILVRFVLSFLFISNFM